jgi:hypothetical protein|tara:strand:- start:412 stop:522 length:111 start_codon:yes stop_codon:yes gene_type:complete
MSLHVGAGVQLKKTILLTTALKPFSGLKMMVRLLLQ